MLCSFRNIALTTGMICLRYNFGKAQQAAVEDIASLKLIAAVKDVDLTIGKVQARVEIR